MSNEGEEEGGVEVEGEDVGGSGDGGGVIVFYNNNKVNNKPASPSPSRTLPAVCAQCQDAEAKRAQMRAQYETEIARVSYNFLFISLQELKFCCSLIAAEEGGGSSDKDKGGGGDEVRDE